ncbi:HAD family phosphatase [Dehalogenimonas sp. THU2]|uniref:HAD family hydrolase n=1 Tax=Dehalogenimonas sp. THU2 TaxID=3151121 RepID=UPI0032189035
MIRGMIFDLDGVLVQTEKLKAKAYALAVQQIRRLPEPDARAGEAYREVVGSSREITSRHVMDKLGLEAELRALMPEYEATEPWEVLTAIRYKIYDRMVADPQVIRDNQWSYNIKILSEARALGCRTALATLSKRKDVDHVVESLGIGPLLDVILTAEDISKGKPDPEIYLTAAKRLGVQPNECIVLEDSVNGITAAQKAGMYVVAIATPFTNASIHLNEIIKEAWIVHKPDKVAAVVRSCIRAINARETSEADRTETVR